MEQLLLDEQSKGTHWVVLFIGINTTVLFEPFGIEYAS